MLKRKILVDQKRLLKVTSCKTGKGLEHFLQCKSLVLGNIAFMCCRVLATDKEVSDELSTA